MPQYTWDNVNKRNEKHAQEFNAVTKAEVLSFLRDKAEAQASWVRGLSDEQLDRTAPMPLADNAVVTTQQLIEGGDPDRICAGAPGEHSRRAVGGGKSSTAH